MWAFAGVERKMASANSSFNEGAVPCIHAPLAGPPFILSVRSRVQGHLEWVATATLSREHLDMCVVPGNSPVFWSRTPSLECSRASSCGSVGLLCDSYFAASRREWTRAALRSVCAFSTTFGSHFVEDLWSDLQGKAASPGERQRRVRKARLAKPSGLCSLDKYIQLF